MVQLEDQIQAGWQAGSESEEGAQHSRSCLCDATYSSLTLQSNPPWFRSRWVYSVECDLWRKWANRVLECSFTEGDADGPHRWWRLVMADEPLCVELVMEKAIASRHVDFVGCTKHVRLDSGWPQSEPFKYPRDRGLLRGTKLEDASVLGINWMNVFHIIRQRDSFVHIIHMEYDAGMSRSTNRENPEIHYKSIAKWDLSWVTIIQDTPPYIHSTAADDWGRRRAMDIAEIDRSSFKQVTFNRWPIRIECIWVWMADVSACCCSACCDGKRNWKCGECWMSEAIYGRDGPFCGPCGVWTFDLSIDGAVLGVDDGWVALFWFGLEAVIETLMLTGCERWNLHNWNGFVFGRIKGSNSSQLVVVLFLFLPG